MKKVVIPLRKPWTLLVLTSHMFGACAWFFVDKAMTNDRGLVINGILPLERGSADVFYAVLGILSFGFVAIAIACMIGLVRRARFDVIVGKKSIVFPNARLWHPEHEIRVEYVDLASVRTNKNFVAFDTREGLRVLNARWLPEAWPANKVADLVVARWRGEAESE